MAKKQERQYLNPQEKTKAKEKFGDVGCTLAKDKQGYYAYTHRARSKSYPSIEKLPKKVVQFIDSTC